MGKIKWRRKANGRPIGPNAAYIMANDHHAAAAFEALRQKGMTPAEARAQIEQVFDAAFRFIVFTYCKDDVRPPDPRPECWFLLAEGLPG